jgi:hypothetical protein
VADYQRALAGGDLHAIVATFEPDAYAREPSGGGYVYRGLDGLRGFYEHLFSNGAASRWSTARSRTTDVRVQSNTTW